MTRRALFRLSSWPIKWKLTLASGILVFLFFSFYNTVQYFFVERWIWNDEKSDAEQTMTSLLNYFLERETGFDEVNLKDVRDYLNRINQDHQMIRIVNSELETVVAVGGSVKEAWLEPQWKPDPELQRVRAEGHSLLVNRSPLTIFQFNGSIEIVRSLQDYDRMLNAIYRVMFAFGIVAVVASALIGGLMARQLLKPVQAMTTTIKKIREQGMRERMAPPSSQDELSELADMFNAMMEQLERSFEQQAQFVEDASHELRTPLAIIEGHLTMLQRWGKQDAAVLEESLRASMQELTRLKGLVQELLALSRADNESVDPKTVVNDADIAIRRMMGKMATLFPDVSFEAELESLSGTTLAVSKEHLEQILLIVLDNAVQHGGDGNRILVRGRISDQGACIDVIDDGIGIPLKDLPYVMDRFYRVDKARSREQGGNGLGLAIASRLVQRYKGTMEITSKERMGTTVSISLRHSPTTVHRWEVYKP